MSAETSQGLINLLTGYATLAAEALEPTPPSRIIEVQPGANATWDGCKDGQLWVRLQGLEPSPGATPSRRHGADLCAVPEWVVTMQLGIIRCAATMDSRGNPPSVKAITADGRQGIGDMTALLGMLAAHPRTRSVSTWTPTGPEGGFHGGYFTFTAVMANLLLQEG